MRDMRALLGTVMVHALQSGSLADVLHQVCTLGRMLVLEPRQGGHDGL